jgi:hypothetical protein
MAGEWIKMRKDLDDDPAVIAIAQAVGLDEFAVVGRLWKFWAWADTHTTDGNASCVTGVTAVAWLERYIGCAGIAQAMNAVGWLLIDDEGIHVPNFDVHNGESAKQRALTSRRVAKNRGCNAKRNATSVTSVTHDALSDALPEKRREEKRREEDLDETSRVDHGCSLSLEKWDPGLIQGVRRRANELFRRAVPFRTADDRAYLLKIAALVEAGALAPALAVSAVEACRQRKEPPENAVAYYTSVLADETRKAGVNLGRLLVGVELPEALTKRNDEAKEPVRCE